MRICSEQKLQEKERKISILHIVSSKILNDLRSMNVNMECQSYWYRSLSLNLNYLSSTNITNYLVN